MLDEREVSLYALIHAPLKIDMPNLVNYLKGTPIY